LSANEREEKAKTLFESRFLSIVLMICLLLMNLLFIVIIGQIFGWDQAYKILMYLGIGIGGGIIITFGILLVLRSKKTSLSRNVLLGLTAAILIISLILSLILKFAIADVELSSWAFIYTSAIGLGITSGIALTYLILAMIKNSLVRRPNEEKTEIIEDETTNDDNN